MASSVEDQLNLDALHEMKKKFDAADEDGNDGIELDEFIQHFADVLGGGSLTETQLRQLFMKIDADGNGSVDWDEFTNFMFLMRAPAPSDDDDRAVTSAYADSPTHLDLDEDDLASRGGSSAASHADVITVRRVRPVPRQGGHREQRRDLDALARRGLLARRHGEKPRRGERREDPALDHRDQGPDGLARAE